MIKLLYARSVSLEEKGGLRSFTKSKGSTESVR